MSDFEEECFCDSYTPTGKETYKTYSGWSEYYQEQKCDICGKIFCERFKYIGTDDRSVEEIENDEVE